jgi:hypothetical protein
MIGNLKLLKQAKTLKLEVFSWDVEYEKKTPKLYDFKESYNDLNELVNNMVKINGGIKPTDPKLEELVLVIKNIRNRYKRYLNQYQPDWNS